VNKLDISAFYLLRFGSLSRLHVALAVVGSLNGAGGQGPSGSGYNTKREGSRQSPKKADNKPGEQNPRAQGSGSGQDKSLSLSLTIISTEAILAALHMTYHPVVFLPILNPARV